MHAYLQAVQIQLASQPAICMQLCYTIHSDVKDKVYSYMLQVHIRTFGTVTCNAFYHFSIEITTRFVLYCICITILTLTLICSDRESVLLPVFTFSGCGGNVTDLVKYTRQIIIMNDRELATVEGIRFNCKKLLYSDPQLQSWNIVNWV